MNTDLQLPFDYAALDAETRIVVQQRTEEIRVLVRRSAQDIIDIGAKLIEVKARLGHGNFGPWLEAEFGWSQDTANRFVQVAQRFGQIPQIADFAPSALYLLSAPSTPEPARLEAIARATNGETITHAIARGIVNEYKPTSMPGRAFAYSPVVDDDLPEWTPDEADRQEDGLNLVTVRDSSGYEQTVRLPANASWEITPIEQPPDTSKYKVTWTPSELARRARVEAGETVHANMKTDMALIEWAKDNGLFVRVDRATEWGNPFLLPADGTRAEVIDNYGWYLKRKPSLLAKLPELRGKVLGCWCYPEACHAEILEAQLDDYID